MPGSAAHVLRNHGSSPPPFCPRHSVSMIPPSPCQPHFPQHRRVKDKWGGRGSPPDVLPASCLRGGGSEALGSRLAAAQPGAVPVWPDPSQLPRPGRLALRHGWLALLFPEPRGSCRIWKFCMSCWQRFTLGIRKRGKAVFSWLSSDGNGFRGEL